ncbi:DEAD/DEAH box helicase family protein [Micromonospora musae]|uniref:hypothetical protein n=1 Tax=Micromonospora musae TaxID=1894970 RepID=UPI0011C45953|nr:hypothetical protein [Micromonospora musae]
MAATQLDVQLRPQGLSLPWFACKDVLVSLAEAEYVAIAVEAIRRSVGFRMGEAHLATALAMVDEAEGRRARRARKSIATLRPLVGNADPITYYHNEELSLTAAIPAFRFALAGRPVHVVFHADDDSRRMHGVYEKIAEELHLVDGIGLLTDPAPRDRTVDTVAQREELDRRVSDLLGNYDRPFTVGGFTRFRYALSLGLRRPPKDCVAILRVPDARKSFAHWGYKRLTAL